MTDVSIIIVNWNTRDILRDCLKSIYSQINNISYELIVVDNASTDGSATMVKKEFPKVILIENFRNAGFAAANNQGMQIATCRYFLLLNPDTIILDGAIQKTVMFADEHTDIGVLGCQVWLNEKEIQQTCFSFPSLPGLIFQEAGLRRLFPQSHFLGRSNYGWWDRRNEMDVDVVSGMYMLVRREAVNQVGLMDEDYFVYAEETDWCYRFWKAGWRCTFTPKARIIHLDGGSKSTAQISKKMFVQMQKSMLIFYKKQKGCGSWLCAKSIFLLSMLFKYLIFTVLSFFKKNNSFYKKSQQTLAALMFHLLRIEPR
jgi:hypothetical protein